MYSQFYTTTTPEERLQDNYPLLYTVIIIT